MFTIAVHSKSTGRPVKSAKVRICFSGFSGGLTDSQYTDTEGETHFKNEPGVGIVYVNGNEIDGKRMIKGRIVVYI